MKLYDVTVPVSPALPTHPGDPPVAFMPVQRIAEGDATNVTKLTLSCHAGTHVDAPWHFIEHGTRSDELPLELLIGRTRVIEVPTRRGIGVEALSEVDLRDDIRVLIKTLNSSYWASSEFRSDYAFLTEAAARLLVDNGIKVIGIDYLSVEEWGNEAAPAHHLLLGSGSIIIEGLNLADIEAGIYEMTCLPLKLKGLDGAPARVILRKS